MNYTPLIFLLIGFILIWAVAINGNFGTFLAAIFEPERIVFKN